MERTATKRFAALFLWALAALYTGARLMLDLVGYTTAPEDFAAFQDKLPQWLEWLFSTPWQVPAGIMIALTVFVMWMSWPRDVREPNSKLLPSPKMRSLDKILPSTKPVAPSPPLEHDTATKISTWIQFVTTDDIINKTLIEADSANVKSWLVLKESNSSTLSITSVLSETYMYFEFSKPSYFDAVKCTMSGRYGDSKEVDATVQLKSPHGALVKIVLSIVLENKVRLDFT